MQTNKAISLGLDTAIAALGWCVIKGDSTLIDYGVARTPKDAPMGRRLTELDKDVDYLFRVYKPTQVGIEFPFFGRDKTAQGKVLAALGVLSLVCDRFSIIPALYHPSQVKAAVAKGNADKKEVAWAVAQLFGVDGVPDDVSDAIAIAYCRAIGLTSNIAW